MAANERSSWALTSIARTGRRNKRRAWRIHEKAHYTKTKLLLEVGRLSFGGGRFVPIDFLTSQSRRRLSCRSRQESGLRPLLRALQNIERARSSINFLAGHSQLPRRHTTAPHWFQSETGGGVDDKRVAPKLLYCTKQAALFRATMHEATRFLQPIRLIS